MRGYCARKAPSPQIQLTIKNGCPHSVKGTTLNIHPIKSFLTLFHQWRPPTVRRDHCALLL